MIEVDGSDSGTILAGDAVSFAGDSSKYMVQSSTASGAASGNIVIQKPGLQSTLAQNAEGTLSASYTANMAFHRSAIVVATRAPAVPTGGDSADDSLLITDPVTGLTFRVSVYRQHKQVLYMVEAVWGYEMIIPAFAAVLLG